jgi:ketosteroid isomerase-like protein
VKRCPTCNRTFTDQNLSFCTDDGTPLVSVEGADDEATILMPSAGGRQADSAGQGQSGTPEDRNVPAYQSPGPYVPPSYAEQSKRRTWPWLLGILVIVFVIFAGLGIAAAIMIPRIMRASSNTNSSNLNSNPGQRNDANLNSYGRDSNLNSNSAAANENTNDNSADDTTSPPADEAEVLQALTDLEHEWTVANINADKKKLDRILADDYVGTSADGKSQGKAEYLRTATRDEAIQRWEFENLKLSLKGDRATLTGIIMLDVKNEQGQNQNLAFHFTDKFVWRDGRWQATGSEVSPVKEQERS